MGFSGGAIVFAGRVWPFDSAAAVAFAAIFAGHRAAGQPISFPDCQFPDCQIAAIASARGAALATRNVSDFVDCGIKLIDPWNNEKAR